MLTAHAYTSRPPARLPRVLRWSPTWCTAASARTRTGVRRAGGGGDLAHAAGIRVPSTGRTTTIDDLTDQARTRPTTAAGPASADRRDPYRLRPPRRPAGRHRRHARPVLARLREHLDTDLDHVTLRRRAGLLLRGAVGYDLRSGRCSTP